MQQESVTIGGTQYTEGQRAEVPDPTPVEMPVGYHHPEPLEHMIARLVRYESAQAAQQGQETFEESDDFDVEGEEVEMISPYEMKQMQEEYPRGPIKDRTDAPVKGAKTQEKQEVKPPTKAPKKVAAKVEKEPESETADE